MDSITRIKDFIRNNFPEWKKVDYSKYGEDINFRKDWSELYKIDNEEIILISYTNISITGTDRAKPQLRVFLDEYKKPFYFAKKHQLRFYLFSIFTKDDEMAKGLNNFNPKEYIISIETNLDNEDSRRDLRSIYDYANEKLNGKKFLKCTRANYKADINQASFIYIGTPKAPDKHTFESFINIFDSRPYINSRNEANGQTTNIIPTVEANNYRPFITAIKSKPFLLLAGISGTVKSRIVRELARACWDEGSDEYEAQKPKNFEMIQVKPNWHDSSELIGYVSRIDGVRYVVGPFLRFMVKAIQDPETPYFLCLDEMNLAPVEQYFAEYLSVVESRKRQENGTITTDPIIDYSDTEEYVSLIHQLFPDDDDLREEYLTEDGGKRLSIPNNLIVVGTVNMDETTFSFSRKVLDRAMTIEMNIVDLEGGLLDKYEKIGKIEKEDLIGTAVEGVDVYSTYQNVCDIAIDYLQSINNKLEGTPFKIAYRTRNEVLLYVVNNLPYNKVEGDDESTYKEEFIIARALDEITNMKILSRIEGDESKVSKKFLEDLGEAIKNGLEKVFAEMFDEDDDGLYVSVSLAKLEEMKERLKSGYTSFWS